MNSIEKNIIVKEIDTNPVTLNNYSSRIEKNKLVVFDFDETLVKSKHVFDMINKYTLDLFNLYYNDEILKKFFFTYDKEYFGWGKNLEEQKNIYLNKVAPFITSLSNDTQYIKQVEFYNGMKQVITELARTDIALAIASSRDLGSILSFLKYEGVRNCFDIVEATEGGKNFDDKPSTHIIDYISTELGISTENSVMVGDTPMDIEMAKNAGMKTVAIGFGRISKIDELKKYKPDVLLSKEKEISQLPVIFSNLLKDDKER